MTALSSLKVARVRQIVAVVSGWLLLLMATLCGLTVFFLVKTPEGESLPYLRIFLSILGESPTGHLTTISIVSFLVALVCFLVSQLQVREYPAMNHEHMMQMVVEIIPLTVKDMLDEIIRNSTDITVYSRLMDKLRQAFPGVKSEYLELASAVGLLVHKDISPLLEKSRELAALVDSQEQETLTAIEKMDEIRRRFNELLPRVKKLKEEHGDTVIQAKYLLRDTEELKRRLEELSNPNPPNVYQLRPGE